MSGAAERARRERPHTPRLRVQPVRRVDLAYHVRSGIDRGPNRSLLPPDPYRPVRRIRALLSTYRVTVVKIGSVVACAESGLYWEKDVEPAKCTDDNHQHRVFEVHRHLDLVALPDGTKFTAASFDPRDPYSRHLLPDFGLYLDSRWQPPWDHAHIDWPDFGLPDDPFVVHRSLSAFRNRARSGERVEVGCLGGHGRTGTALACLAVLAGHPAGDAVNWVRAHYCSRAVETPEQEAFVAVMHLS